MDTTQKFNESFQKKTFGTLFSQIPRFFHKIQLYRCDSQEFYCLSILVLCVTKISVFWRANRFFTVKICSLFILHGVCRGKLGCVIHVHTTSIVAVWRIFSRPVVSLATPSLYNSSYRTRKTNNRKECNSHVKILKTQRIGYTTFECTITIQLPF